MSENEQQPGAQTKPFKRSLFRLDFYDPKGRFVKFPLELAQKILSNSENIEVTDTDPMNYTAFELNLGKFFHPFLKILAGAEDVDPNSPGAKFAQMLLNVMDNDFKTHSENGKKGAQAKAEKRTPPAQNTPPRTSSNRMPPDVREQVDRMERSLLSSH